MRVAALILAGGSGERLGGIVKANVEIGGMRLLDRVTAALSSASPILLAYGHVAPAALNLDDRYVAVPDLAADYGGPLAGLAGAVAWCGTQAAAPDLLLTAAVDTPFLPYGFPSKMVEAIGEDGAAVVASYAGQDYPTNAIWRLATIADLPARVTAGTAPHSLKRLAMELHAARLDWPETPSGDPFANANTADDLAALRRRAEPGA